jgi:group I intron endonuclease
VTSPSGKVYIGKTSVSLSKRKSDHKWLAKTKDFIFGRAIKKYGDLLKWEEIEKVKGLEAANERECFWIDHYKSNNKDYGYNLTAGGDGGKRTQEAEDKRVEAIKKAYLNPAVLDNIRIQSTQRWQDQSYKDRLSNSIKKTRSSEESRNKTVKQMEKQKSDPDWLAKVSEASKKSNAKPEVKAKLSSSLRKTKARSFVAIKDGEIVAKFENQADAAVSLKLRPESISRCLGGFLKKTGGYVFKYLNEPETDSTVIRKGGSNEQYSKGSSDT